MLGAWHRPQSAVNNLCNAYNRYNAPPLALSQVAALHILPAMGARGCT